MALPAKLYVVTLQKGDTMQQFANFSGITLAELMDVNPAIKNPNIIRVGEKVFLYGDGASNFARIRNMVLDQKALLPNTQGNWGSWTNPTPERKPLEITITGGVVPKTNIWMLVGGALILMALLNKKKR